MFRIARVSGNSLYPEYQDGDFVVVSKIPYLFVCPRDGDVVLFRHPEYGLLIKRVDGTRSEADHLFVIGSVPESIDSRHFGPVPIREVLGKVIWHVLRPRR